MLAWLLYFLSAFGAAYIVGHARISLAIRSMLAGTPESAPGADDDVKPLVPVLGPFFVEMLECAACFGFWYGLAAAIAGWAPADRPYAVLLAISTSGANFIIGRFTKLI